MYNSPRLRLLALLLVALASCSEDPVAPGDDLPPGRFEAEATGAVAGPLSGTAFSADGQDTDELRVWGVDLDDDDGERELFLFFRGNRIPSPGSTFTVGPWPGLVPPPGEAAALLSVRASDGLVSYRSTSGTAALTDRSTEWDRAHGTFDLVLVGPTSDTVRVEGRFHTRENADSIDSLSGS